MQVYENPRKQKIRQFHLQDYLTEQFSLLDFYFFYEAYVIEGFLQLFLKTKRLRMIVDNVIYMPYEGLRDYEKQCCKTSADLTHLV